MPCAELSTGKHNKGEVILQLSSLLCPTSHYEVTYTDNKQLQGFHRVTSKKTRQLKYCLRCADLLD